MYSCAYTYSRYVHTYVPTYMVANIQYVCAPDVHTVTAYALDDSASLSLALAEHYDQS